MSFMRSIAEEFRGFSASSLVWCVRVSVWVGSAYAQPLTYFRASFDPPGTGAATGFHASDFGWAVAVAGGKSRGGEVSLGIDAGTPSFLGGHTPSTQSGRAGFLFASPPEGHAPRAMMLHTLHLGVADHIRSENKRDWLVGGRGTLVGL